MSTGVDAMKMPDSPPITNIDTKAIALSIGVVRRMFPPQSVPSQLNVLMAEGTAITMVESMKLVPRAGLMPLWNMWCPHTIQERNAMPIFGYHAMAFSMIGIAFLSWIVWGHHMFQSGMSPALGTSFMLSTMVIAVPSAIKTFNWLGTLWGGNILLTTPMLNAIAFVSMFVIGGLSGIFMASTPVDIYIHDTYFIVAHIHYVVFGGSIFGAFAAIYFWFPKMFGRLMNETLGKIHFAFTFIGFNWTFFPMHILGVGGHMRRIYDPTQYDFLKPFQPMNTFITYGALILGAGQLILIVNFFRSMFAGKVAGKNPWQANTLEWEAQSPPPHGNFPGPLPTVYRGPYEYSSPLVAEDYLPQARRLEPQTAAAAAH